MGHSLGRQERLSLLEAGPREEELLEAGAVYEEKEQGSGEEEELPMLKTSQCVLV